MAMIVDAPLDPMSDLVRHIEDSYLLRGRRGLGNHCREALVGVRDDLGTRGEQLVPPASAMSRPYPLAQRGRLDLGLGYCWRALQLIATAITGVWTWWRARRAVAPIHETQTRSEP